MARLDAAALLPLAESIADGAPVDWDAIEAAANGDEQAVIRQLRVLANLAVLHRSLPADTADSRPTTSGRRTSAAPAIGSWAHLALVERLGGGTFGDVYRAWDQHLEREVALKLLRGDDASLDDPHASRIATEGRLLARIRHQNVITVHGVAVHEHRVGLWMELVRGATLEQVLQKHGPFSAREAVGAGIDLCRALAAIHAAGLIHRDVKAQNVMREDGGRIVLMDLGTGREIDPDGGRPLSDMAGTPLYLAPEIFDGAPASERSDLYSLGVLLYHLVTGAFPVRATTIAGLQAAHANGMAVRLRDARADLPTEFVRVVERATAREPERRYASAGALEADLVDALGGSAERAAPRRVDDRADRVDAARRGPGWLAMGIAALCLGAIALWAVSFIRSRLTPARPTALVAGKVRLAVLPVEDFTGQPAIAHWPQLIQMLFVEELAGVQDVAVTDPLSMNALIASKLGAAGRQRNAELFDVVRGANASLVIDGAILAAGAGGYDLRLTLIDPVSREVRFPVTVKAATEEQLAGAVRSAAAGILGYLQLQVLPLANDKDLRPWISTKRQNIQAVNAFLQASQHVFRYERNEVDRFLERAIALDPSFIEPRVWAMPGLITRNEIAKARSHYEALLKLEPNASPFEQAMIGYAGARLTGDPAAQVRYLAVALEYVPGNNILLVNLAGAKYRLGDYAGALEAMRPAVGMRWRFPPLYECWGSCSIQTGRIAEARQVMVDALALKPVHPNVFALLGALAIADGDTVSSDRYDALFAAGIRELDRPASPAPYLVDAYGKLASDCLTRGQYDRAAALFAKAIAVAPRAPKYYDGLGQTLDRMGDARQAEVQYRKALAADPKWPHAYLMLGRTYDARHDSAAAVRFYRTFVSLAPPGPDVDAVKQRLRELETKRRD